MPEDAIEICANDTVPYSTQFLNNVGTPSFLIGTMITTDKGEMPIEYLAPGDLIQTKDAGFVPLRAIGLVTISRWDMVRSPELRPVVFPTNSIGNTAPLHVCGMHRVYLNSVFADMIFGVPEVLAPARSCVGHRGISTDERKKPPHYYQLMLDQHEAILSNGAWSESFLSSDVRARTHETPIEWLEHPDVSAADIHHKDAARMVLNQREARVLFDKMNADGIMAS